MSVFDFEGEGGQQHHQDPPGDDEVVDIQAVSVLESSDGNGSTRYRSTIPKDFAKAMDLSKGDTLVMKRTEDGIFIPDHS